MPRDVAFMRQALRLARKAYGLTSPNPIVGALLTRRGRVVGRGWHHQAGQPHAEIEAINDAVRRGHSPAGTTLYVTLEPCSTTGRTPPCTTAIIQAGIRRVVAATADPNPRHAGRGIQVLQQAGVEVTQGLLADEAARLNEPFNHWIVHHTPLVTVKAALTLDGKIATARGESKWITSEGARAQAMNLRLGADAILVGVKTVIQDNPSLTYRPATSAPRHRIARIKPLRRFILDSRARTPLTARVVSDAQAHLTTIVATRAAPAHRVAALRRHVRVLIAPAVAGRVDLRWLLNQLGQEAVTHLLVEGGGEVQASFLQADLAHRITFFYAPKILGGRDARKAVAGPGATARTGILRLQDLRWRGLPPDLWLTAKLQPAAPGSHLPPSQGIVAPGHRHSPGKMN